MVRVRPRKPRIESPEYFRLVSISNIYIYPILDYPEYFPESGGTVTVGTYIVTLLLFRNPGYHAVLCDEYLARHLGSFLVGDDLLK